MMDEKKMDERFMREAIRQARKAGALMEVPIGCVIVYEERLLQEDTIGEIRIKIRFPMRN